MSADDERDPSAETTPPEQRPDPDLLGSFNAFRARRAEERAQAEPLPDEYGHYEDEQQYEHEYAPPPQPVAPMPVPGFEYAQFPPQDHPQVHETTRRPWRSVAVFGGVAALAVGLGAGLYAALQPSDHARDASSPLTTASASASPGPKAAKGDGKAVTTRLTVTAVTADSFTATAHGQTVVVHLTSQTRFGTAARPFTRAQLVDGAVVYARLRHEADGTVVATVVAASSPSSTPTMTPTDGIGAAAGA